jgi:hypothetical protein
MGVKVCPIALVAAPVEVVWANLVQWERYFEWADVRVERVEPEGPATLGQTVIFAGKALGRTLRFTFNVTAVDPEKYQIELHAFFPLGLEEKAHIAVDSLDATTCRVAYG